MGFWVCVLPEHHCHHSPQAGSPFDPLCLPQILSGSPRITRGTDAMTLPLVASSSLAMWCSMSLSFPFPPLPLPLRLRSLTSPLCFLLTRWSSHLSRCFLQVLLRRLSPVTPRGLYPARVPRCHLPARPLRLTRVPGWHLRHRPHRHVSPSRCASTSDVPGWRRCLRRRRWPPLRRGHLRHR